MRIVHGADQGRRTLLARQPLGHTELPPRIREHNAKLFGEDLPVEEQVRRILADVRKDGDAALARYTKAFTGADYSTFEVTRIEIEDAYERVDAQVVRALEHAKQRVADYHERQLEHSSRSFSHQGIGMVVRPLQRIGLYAPTSPGAVYPSSVLMTAIPAKVAGVQQVVMMSPAGDDGVMSPVKLVAADIAGVDRVFKAGGAEAIAALAYGTESVPRVDKIVGPGSLFVTVAKREVFGDVGIDGVYGPTETVVVADDTADAAVVAADLLAQAEHDELATSILITTSASLAEAVSAEIDQQLRDLERAPIAGASINGRGGAVVVDTVEAAVALASEFAPEHLCLIVRNAAEVAKTVTNAGGVFIGDESPEVLGDYAAGPSHVMPTGGAARFASPLGVQDFLKITSVIDIDSAQLNHAGKSAAIIARAEGLTAHARSMEMRLHERRTN
jgi:histidinol dehydrogenase